MKEKPQLPLDLTFADEERTRAAQRAWVTPADGSSCVWLAVVDEGAGHGRVDGAVLVVIDRLDPLEWAHHATRADLNRECCHRALVHCARRSRSGCICPFHVVCHLSCNWCELLLNDSIFSRTNWVYYYLKLR